MPIKPDVEGVYAATVRDILKIGLKVELNGFKESYEGLIHSSELEGNLKNLIVGNHIKVRIVSFASDIITMTSRGIEQPLNVDGEAKTARRKELDQVYEAQKRRIRVASPGRNEIKQFANPMTDVKIEVREDLPFFLRSLSNSIMPSKIPKEIKIFRNQNSFMAKIAIERTRNLTIPPFYFTQSGFNTLWTRPNKLHDVFEKLSLTKCARNTPAIDYRKRSQMTLKQQRESLPIFQFREEIIRDVTNNPVLIVIAETGSGKTTQIPQYLAEAGFGMQGKIACTQPRRFAATSVARRVAEEQHCMLGQEVGFKIRFEDYTSPKTVIKYMTDGILLRECLSDPNLSQYKVIILDEAHERTRDTDVLFGLLKEAVKRRPSLRLIISSATLNYEKFSNFFDGAKVLHIPGSMYPVETFYHHVAVADYFTLALQTALNIHMREEEGDILLFLTGQEEIERAIDTLEEELAKSRSLFSRDLILLPMFSQLPPELQLDVLMPAPPRSRKLIIATNIAEASVTFDGVKFVIDPGYCKQKVNDPKTGTDQLIIIPISQASANQRLGRAGRTAPGKCYRLYTEKQYEEELLPETVPELQRSDLSSVILYLKAINIVDVVNFDFMDPPQKESIISSLKLLFLLTALDDRGYVTEIGRQMTQLPIDPIFAKMLILSVAEKCTDEIITIIAMLNVGNVFYRPRKKRQLAEEKKREFDHAVGDHMRLLNVYKKYELNYCSAEWCKSNFLNERKLQEAQEIRQNLLGLMEKLNTTIYSAGYNYERIQKTIVSGFFQNIAKRNVALFTKQNKSYIRFDGTTTFIHPSSGIFHQLPSWIVFNNMTETSKKFLNECTVINPMWLPELFPSLYSAKAHGYMF